MTALPIDPLLPDIVARLDEHTALVLVAPPGAGKTTRVPLALLGSPWLAGQRILMLEPRRLAARAAAQRIAHTLGETVGATVGYRIRLERRLGPRTLIEVVTEGILTRRLQGDPGLEGVGLVIFDEFHERSLDADLGLALVRDMQRNLRPELRLLVMSATLDGAAVARLLDNAPVIESEGRAFPVETRHLEAPPRERLAPAVVAAIERAADETEGDILVFLPGEREIRAAERLLHDGGPDQALVVAPLYGALAQSAQDIALAPAPAGRRKVILATSVAETSLTIEGVRTVIDGGYARAPRFDPVTGLTRLETLRVSQASAEQRRGRAGRLGPGICYRLWPEATTRGLPPHAAPEILQADLAPLALELALWGVRDPGDLVWLDPPPPGTFGQAKALLHQLGALDASERVTDHGRAIARLPMHPRLAHMALVAMQRGLGQEAAALAALIEERDILVGPGATRDADLRGRLEFLSDARARRHLPPGCELRQGALRRAAEAARQSRRLLDLPERPLAAHHAGPLAALAYPDRIAQLRPTGGFRLANGRGAVLAEEDPLAREPWLAVAEVSGGSPDGRIFLAAPLTREEIEAAFADLIEEVEEIAWDPRSESVQARRQRRLGALLLDDLPWPGAPPERVAAALLEGIRTLGLGSLPWTPPARNLQARVALLRAQDGPASDWPDFSDRALASTLEAWLLPHLPGKRSRAQLASLDLAEILASRLAYAQRRRLEAEAPTHLEVPSGRRAALDYLAPDGPVLAVKLQELFGLAETPRIARGRVPVLLHLLSPAGRPVQVTRDLASFWRTGYAEVKRDLKGRYPKHPWPDDPTTAMPTARTHRRS
jgi:ATP-dependent helicase HrpB